MWTIAVRASFARYHIRLFYQKNSIKTDWMLDSG